MKVKSSLFIIAGTLCSSIALAAVPMPPQSMNSDSYAANPSYNTTNNTQMAQQLAQLQQEVAELQHSSYYHNQASSITKVPAGQQQQAMASTPPQGRLPFSAGSIFGNLVVTGPSVGITTHYDGSSLIVNSPSIYTDYKLLQRKQKEMHELAMKGYAKPEHPHLVLSGNIEGLISYLNPYSGDDESDIDLSAAELDSYVEVSSWVNGFMSFTYDDGPSAADPNRVNHSRLQLDRGFITLGNLNKAPVFGSIGQMYVPFGRYSNSTISAPLTKVMGRTKARTVDVGFRLNQSNTPYLTGYVFRPHTDDSSTPTINGYGVDGGYAFDINKVTGDFGVGYISTIADSAGIQSAGFGGISSGVKTLDCDVPGLNVHGDIGYGPVTLIGELVMATDSFNASEMSYNSGGAKPLSFDFEGDYGFNGPWSKPMTFALGYSHTEEAVAIALPKDRYIAALTTAIQRDTLLKLEYRHDVDYSSGDTGSIRSSYDPDTNVFGTTTRTGTGCSSDSVILALDIYF